LRNLDGKVLRVFEKDGSTWSWEKDYVYRGGLLLASRDTTGTLHFTLDHLGTPRYVMDQNGLNPIEHEYFGFGEEATTTGLEEAMKFTGHERDLEGTPDRLDDLDYMHARYFSPVLGRFLSVDPVLGDTSSSQNWNRYSYVWNNPLNAVDPLGATVFLVAYTTGNSRGDEEFRRAAETRAEEIRQRNGFDPDSDTVLLRGVKSKADFVAALDEANALDSQYGEVGELSLFSHSGPEDGPIFHDSAGASSQLNKQEAMGLDINWAHDATATFYSCNSADNFSSMFAHAQGVETFGFQNYTYFSSDPDRRVGPHSSGPLYLIDAPGYRNGRFSGWLHLKRGTAYSRPPVGVDPEWVWK
jgi:RHS repeat-associated protein